VLDEEILKAQAKIQAKDEYITKLQIIHEQAEVNNSARSMLTLLRDVFSQQRAQARYLASKADELNARLASFLEMTGMPFNLYLDKDQRVFKYTSEGGFEHPTAHLSGAQKNISAVALQMALVEVISPNINLFLFDEPSESLDTENKIVMSELFKRMNRLLPSIGGTMLIVSRDEQLIEACEQTININSREETSK
jgi:DNA repair exonuclease SbcCD ATPase subunit